MQGIAQRSRWPPGYPYFATYCFCVLVRHWRSVSVAVDVAAGAAVAVAEVVVVVAHAAEAEAAAVVAEVVAVSGTH